MSRRVVRGRGAVANPGNRFDGIDYLPDPEALQAQADAGEAPERPRTALLRDRSRSVITYNDSPDVNFDASINPYRGCEHGCAYCFARPTHEYLGLSAGLDFETRILVKEQAPELLRRELARPGWRPQTLGLSGVTDPYQPVERRLRLTRGCLEVLCEARNPVMVITKNYLVTRDIDLLGELARRGLAAVCVSLPTIDAALSRVLEPRTSQPQRRLDAVGRLAEAGIPVVVLVAPVIHGLTDHEIPDVIAAASRAGATHAGYVTLRLPLAVAPLFSAWLEEHRPHQARKVLERVRSLRGGALNEAAFGSRMRGQGPFAKLIEQLFAGACRRHGVNAERLRLRTDLFRRPRADGRPASAVRGLELPMSDAEHTAPWSPEVFDDPSTGVEVREPPLFQVIMHNDHYTTMEFVVSVLEGVFHKSPSEATQIMLAIHRHGSGRCGVYTREVAEMKIEHVHRLAARA